MRKADRVRVISQAMSLLSRRRTKVQRRGGRPAKLAPCPHCGLVLNATERRRHLCYSS